MRRMAILFVAGALALASPVLAQEPGGGEKNGDGELAGVRIEPIRAGQLEISPIMSARFSGNTLVYRAGVSVGYAVTRWHQVGGSFVLGNRLWDRTNRQEVQVSTPVRSAGTTAFSVDDGFGSSLTGYYRLNIPYQVERRVYPFLEVFGGRDYWGWGDVSEVGVGAGVRKFLNRSTAVNTGYAFSTLFADGQHESRHVLTAGVSVFFGKK